MKKILSSILFLAFIGTSFANESDLADINIQQKLRELDNNTKKSNELSAEDIFEENIVEPPISKNRFDVGKSMLNLTGLDKVKPPLFDRIDNSVILSEAVLNTQDGAAQGPIFELQSRQNGLLKDDSLYFGGTAAFLPIWLPASTEQGNSINNYNLEYYFLSTLGDWTTVYASLNTFTIDGEWNINPGDMYLMLGNLKKFPVFTYVGLSTVDFGSFDEVTNFIPTLTRKYFMQSGGNVSIAYNEGGLHSSVAFLAPHENQFLQVANAYQGNSKVAVSANLMYTYELEQDGNYWYAGAGYSNSSGFTNNNNDNIGVVDFNFGININKFKFINEFVFTDKKVTQKTDVSATFNLRESFFASVLPSLEDTNFLTNNGNIYSWASQFSYSTELYNRDLIPYISYSQIQQSGTNYATIVETGARYNAFADAWAGVSYTYVKGEADSFVEQDNLLALYLRIFI
ncbi:hypothetical protein LO80_00575 [Candidatus Francisella endociliophora]|uniref:Uncharacterized protein n=1 Tax=Candidatus Francisella endociliophora TaxID=653937 RepID=A0A097EM14_9GAMM|nr:DUF3573 domain-containing protein [Francisella sp. FSC1006]AIT08614.1 hypothetical protein LO80_00575 [Francisella sp. FSC1006]